ncbi:bifunctional 2-polyprenyl-6-hydroxyphenol methylase/3-demethylubiquinol 3-O-methyltransferase UbiG [Maridesulfovibrio ferrireducens]|uniref:class I SAM-dependent methyltransferase n=1 Tax=Maridesulfovibrio ferrireducens TaxID=246191 RepID=UPI001A1C0B2E|nr:class I SAM-dependent methyltransferase [Maridesulfovibrio ferrireducens]MBI9112706.1 class I SAM-dependent methyltransferase [Maridesulfovibrio ferrireducens]
MSQSNYTDNSINTNSSALEHRANLNNKLAQHNLEEWIFSHCAYQKGIRVLDIGCGRGKQSLHLAALLEGDVQITALDASNESLKIVEENAQQLNYKKIITKQMNFNDFDISDEEPYNLIMSAYAIYYANDLVNFICELKKKLAVGGEIFICGFGAGTNREVSTISSKYTSHNMAAHIEDFISSEQLTLLKEEFSYCELVRLHNEISFQDLQTFLDWWRNHGSYIKEIDAKVASEVQEIFKNEESFIVSKEVLGLKLSK